VTLNTCTLELLAEFTKSSVRAPRT